MTSRRIYITLNNNKEKDRIIAAYLSQSYSEPDAIKEAIYRLATNSIQTVQNNPINTETVRMVSNRDVKVKKGANNTQKYEKVTDSNKVMSEPKSDDKVQKGTNDDITLDLAQFSDEEVEVKMDTDDKEELKKKKKKALSQFM